MTDQSPPEENISEEFRQLGKNLVDTLRAAWESPERLRLQSEIEAGLNELAATIRSEVNSFDTSQTGQQLKTEVEELRAKVRSGEAETQVRQELLKALQAINAELARATANWQKSEAGAANASDTPADNQEV